MKIWLYYVVRKKNRAFFKENYKYKTRFKYYLTTIKGGIHMFNLFEEIKGFCKTYGDMFPDHMEYNKKVGK